MGSYTHCFNTSNACVKNRPLKSGKNIDILYSIRAVADYILDIVCGCFFAFIGFWEVVWYEKNKMERGRN